MKNIVILYHADCSDGIAAAWATWKYFGENASYIPIGNQVEPPKGLIDKEIYTVDFAFPKDIARKIIKSNKRLTAIDHHISNKSAIAITYKPLYALKHSGATLAWKYFHGNKKTPIYLRYIEDADLWKLKMPHAKEFVAARQLPEKEIQTIDDLVKKFESANFRKKYFAFGRVLLKYQKILIYNILNNKEEVKIHGKKALVVNSPVFIDQLATIMYQKVPVAIIWHHKKNSIKVSLRSNGTVDVSKIASKYGGGGHKSASAFKLPKNSKLPWLKK